MKWKFPWSCLYLNILFCITTFSLPFPISPTWKAWYKSFKFPSLSLNASTFQEFKIFSIPTIFLRMFPNICLLPLLCWCLTRNNHYSNNFSSFLLCNQWIRLRKEIFEVRDSNVCISIFVVLKNENLLIFKVGLFDVGISLQYNKGHLDTHGY